MRLSQVARKLNIGKNTIIDFLTSKGFEIDDNPNFKIEGEQLQLLTKEFADSAMDKEEASGLTIGKKHQGNVVINAADIVQEQGQEEEEEIFIKNLSNEKLPGADQAVEEEPERIETESPKLKGFKVLGKIELDKKPEDVSKPAAEEKVEPEAKPEVEEVKEEIVEKEEKTTEPVEATQKEEVVEEKEPEAPIKEETPAKVEAETPKAKEEKPVSVEEPKPAKKKKEDVIKAKSETLQGLKVVGKIELPTPTEKKGKKEPKPVASSDDRDKRGKKRPRKRIQKDFKGDNKEGQGATRGQGTDNRGERGARPARPQRGQGQGDNRGRGDNRQRGRIRKGQAPKKEELTDKQISDKIKATLARLSEKSSGGNRAKYKKEKRHAAAEAQEERMMQEQEEAKILKVSEFISANDLAALIGVSVNEIISKCMSLGMFVSINQRLDAETISIIGEEYGYEVKFAEQEDNIEVEEVEDSSDDLIERAPIVTIMGHVDHGKTSLLDYIRSSRVTEGEAGGITQHIGAYDVHTESDKRITFLDTPGHEAFTAMRARGAKLTDIVVIVVAADDAVMPQTKEAINHAQLAEVPIIIAINKIDKPNANPEKIKEDLANINILVEDWGGQFQCQAISAKSGEGVDELLEKILLEAELLELKANPNKKANGTVIEAELDKGRGYVATMLVQGGTMHVGDILLAGAHHGRVKAMFDHRGKTMTEAGPAKPVLVLGLDGAPQAGDKFNIMESEREAREISNKREQLLREQNLRTRKHITLDEIGRRLAIGSFRELNIIVKGDVDGSIEALSDSLLKLSTDEVAINIIHKAVGQISESDVLLASASDAIIIGFQVRPSAGARKLAENEEIEIRLYSIIYDAINEIKDAMEGMLAPDVEEVIVGTAQVREVFKISKVGTVAGCMVIDGNIKRNNNIRLIRDGIVTYSGELGALKRFKDDVNEVRNGFECGMSIKNFNDIKVGDEIESYEEREVKRKL